MSDIIGNMDKIVTIYTNTGMDAGAGGKDNYVLLLETRGYLKKLSGNRTGAFGEILGDNSYHLIVRREATLTDKLNDPSFNNMALKIEIAETITNGTVQRRFTVQTWENLNEDYFYYKFSLTEQRA
jgi:hypothetical protein